MRWYCVPCFAASRLKNSVINPLASAPITRAENANDTLTIGEANGENAVSNFAEAVIPLLA
jgi:hypothetical protein